MGAFDVFVELIAFVFAFIIMPIVIGIIIWNKIDN